MAKLCQACSLLGLQREDFTSSPLEPEGKYNAVAHSGTFGNLRRDRATCSLCELIWISMERSNSTVLAEADDAGIWTLRWAQNTNDYQPDNESEDVQEMFESALYPCFGRDGSREDYGIQLVDDKKSFGFLRGRLVDHLIDMKTVASWIELCKLRHRGQCARSGLDTRSLPPATLDELLVIDVDRLCLCRLPENMEYAALSYVWGSTNPVLTLKHNRAAFCEPNGLNIELPQTVQDAIEVTKALHLRFVWIDALCIQQDNYTTKAILLNAMDAIYADAVITIVAATSNGADSGLSGWSSKSGRTQHCVELSQGLRLGVLPYYQRELLHCEHATRAWTYQETCLSPRCLVFLNGFVYFNCNAAVYSEHVNTDVSGIVPETSANTLGKTDDLYANAIERYVHHVYAYTSRSLTYQSDIANAFCGISAALARSMQSRKLSFGMPASCFDWAILWKSRGALRRTVGFPSWSWMGWKAEIMMCPTHDTDYDQMWLLQGTWIDWQIVSNGVCEMLWNKQDASEAALARVQRIVNEVSEYEKVRLEPSDVIKGDSPSGTDADDSISDEQASSNDRNWSPTYAESTPENPFGRIDEHNEARKSVGFPKYPSEPRIIACESPEPQTLCFAAPVTVLIAGPAIQQPSPGVHESMIALQDRQGQICGSLSLRHPDVSSNSTLKLVLLSVVPFGALGMYHATGQISPITEAFHLGDTVTEYLEGWPRSLDKFDFLNVMLVRETSGKAELVLEDESSSQSVPIHERAGIGFVYRKALSNVDWENIVLA